MDQPSGASGSNPYYENVPPPSRINMDVDMAIRPSTIPSEADFLIGCSSVPGYVSYRDTGKGSWYISNLTEMLETYGQS